MKIRKTVFDGLAAVEMKTARARLIAVTGMGPRIAHLSAIRGKTETRNLLFWDYAKKYRRKDWQLKGGHRVWPTRPLGDEAEETYAADNGPCECRIGAEGVAIHGPEF